MKTINSQDVFTSGINYIKSSVPELSVTNIYMFITWANTAECKGFLF